MKKEENSVQFGKNDKNRLKIKEKAEILVQENFFQKMKRSAEKRTLTPLLLISFFYIQGAVTSNTLILHTSYFFLF